MLGEPLTDRNLGQENMPGGPLAGLPAGIVPRPTDDRLFERSGVWNDAYNGLLLVAGPACTRPCDADGRGAGLTTVPRCRGLWVRRTRSPGGSASDRGPTSTSVHARPCASACCGRRTRRAPGTRCGAGLGISGGGSALVTRTLDWSDCDRLPGVTWDRPTSERMLAALDRAHAFLVDHVGQARDEDLDRLNPTHHEGPMTGRQAVASMARHATCHAGQIAVRRDAYRALTDERSASL